ncbi:hypothetical protein MMC12_008224 [Toensbergia leucococca]|nr:hypothetical protein [Toensbergia leucococca]
MLQPAPTPSPLEDECFIDDLLYYARTGALTDLQTTLSTLPQDPNRTAPHILLTIIDPSSKNGLLHMASANGHTSTIAYLLTPPPPSALLNAQNVSGNTPLHWAALNGHNEAVKLLIAAGADPDLKNKVGHDAMYEAERNGKEEVAEWLLGKGGSGVGKLEGESSAEEKDGVKDIEEGVEGIEFGLED